MIYINRISTIYARAYISNSITTVVEAVFSKTYSITLSRCNCHAATVHNSCITSSIRSSYGLKAFQVFSQLDVIAITSSVFHNTDIIICQTVHISTASKVHSISQSTNHFTAIARLVTLEYTACSCFIIEVVINSFQLIFCCGTTRNCYRIFRIPSFVIQTCYEVAFFTVRSLLAYNYVASFHSICRYGTIIAVNLNLIAAVTSCNRTCRTVDVNLFCRILTKSDLII